MLEYTAAVRRTRNVRQESNCSISSDLADDFTSDRF
jgi:hypothetical protein